MVHLRCSLTKPRTEDFAGLCPSSLRAHERALPGRWLLCPCHLGGGEAGSGQGVERSPRLKEGSRLRTDRPWERLRVRRVVEFPGHRGNVPVVEGLVAYAENTMLSIRPPVSHAAGKALCNMPHTVLEIIRINMA